MSMSYWEGKAEEFYYKHGYYAGEEKMSYEIPNYIEAQLDLTDEYADNGYSLPIACELSFDEDEEYVTVEDIVFTYDDEELDIKKGESVTDEFIKRCTVNESLHAVYVNAEDFANEYLEDLKRFSIDF